MPPEALELTDRYPGACEVLQSPAAGPGVDSPAARRSGIVVHGRRAAERRVRWAATRVPAHLICTLVVIVLVAVAQPSVMAAAEVPERLGLDLEGDPIETSSFRGKVLLVSLWASWCRPCTKELPLLDALQREYESDPVVILALNAGESRYEVQKFLKQHPLSLPVARDPNGKVGRRLGAQGLPAHALIDPSGALCAVVSGGHPELLARIREAIDALLKGDVCSPSSRTQAVRVWLGLRPPPASGRCYGGHQELLARWQAGS